MYSTKARRSLLPGEAAELIGFGPCFTHEDYMHATDRLRDVGPFRTECDVQDPPPLLAALSDSSAETAIFSESTLKSFFGNAMHVDVIHAVLVFLLGCTCPVQDKT